MDEEAFARLLMSDERREWQNPERILDAVPLSKNIIVADLACGPGYFTIPIARKIGPGGTVFAVDSSKVMLRFLERNIAFEPEGEIGKIVPLNNDVLHAEIPSAAADVVLFANILHDIEDKKSFFQVINRISKKNARIVDIDWHKRSMEMGPPEEIRLSENESRNIIRDNGLKVVRTLEAGPHHYGLVCIRG